jgi:Ca-activated chloride channel family protein
MEFLHPNVFYILMIPLIVLFVLLTTSKSGINKYFSVEILEKLSVKSGMIDKKGRNFLYFLVLLLFIVALSRPVIDKKEQNIKQNLIPIVIGLDVSKSMLATDIFPNRISMAKKKLQGIINHAKNTTIGVVLFAKDSFILSPVTEDFVSLQYIVNNLDTNVNFTNGSNIFSLLEATKYMLEDFKVKNLIILSDGGNNSEYKNELEYAKENNIVVYSIGMATKSGAPIPNENGYMTNKNGDIVTVKLNDSIRQFSLKSNGGYIDFTLDDTDLKAIINRINIESEKEELNLQKIKIYTELFYYPLALGLFLLLVAMSSLPTINFKNKNKIISLLFMSIFIFIPKTSNAYTFNFENIQSANEAYKNKEYNKASDDYSKVSTNTQSLYNLANSLYKEGKYEDAIKVYDKVVTTDKELESKKLHNLGNSYVKINDLEKAKEFYLKSLKIKDDKETRENLEIIKKELEKQNQKKEQEKEKKEDKNKENKENGKNDEKSDNDKNQESKENKNDENKNEENKEEKNKKDKQSEQKNENKKTQEKEEVKEKNSTKEPKSDNDTQELKENNTKKDELTDREEKKWMQMLQNQKTPIYLQKVNTQKGSSNDEQQPW